ncbi:Glutathione synthase/RimK-type ligase, ATP-grasp superfamily [Fontimonas thermophila]|uniref:Glutathione synthase/RimK-type ligase, ATP-grasp superfamily n=1 Tax=Fontimonas thermophila TaxID=1076937 RepID=A0A1I2JDY9_9GAMM|nr:RimK family protein [Fontimonas thermophila]SFF53055.1 Glutathione synthase/RimK-type ligase, ATP-grasp superfamily [Fontimonas thermophila]
MSGIVVVDQRTDWPVDIPGIEVVTAWDYLTHEMHTRARRQRVYNLCRSFAYQSTGYYVSLLAGARGHKPLPEITTIQDLKLAESPRIINDEVEELIQRSLARIGSSEYVMNVYFGDSLAKRHERLARALFNLFPAPLLQVKFVYRGEEWRVDSLGPIALGEVPASHHEFLYEAARDYFSRKRSPRVRRESARYDLAILINEDEKEPPSNPRALKLFEKAAEDLGFDVEFIDKSDYGHVAEFDALFIRETTAVNHHTYRFARRAAREGLVVVDDPLSILRAANKVFLAQLMERHRIPQPKTMLIHSRNLKQVAQELGFPCVLKQPDSQFSRGVIKIENAAELKEKAGEMLERSDLIIGQSFEPTDYDWRVGVLDGQPLYACRYFMAKDHWQVVKRAGNGDKVEGGHETLAIEDVPAPVRQIAVQAARAVGNGLYGVDLKQFGKVVKVIEVNDNPNIDHGVEDLVLKEALYRRVMEYFIKRLEARTRT